jgi:hypothetical protein
MRQALPRRSLPHRRAQATGFLLVVATAGCTTISPAAQGPPQAPLALPRHAALLAH